jgi:phosphocarrier protein HPr
MTARSDTQAPADGPRPLVEEFTVSNRLGIHARPAAQFVRVASRFNSDITVEKDSEIVNGKSIMGLMMLAAGQGSKLKVSARGEDARQALDQLGELFTRKFDEE